MKQKESVKKDVKTLGGVKNNINEIQIVIREDTKKPNTSPKNNIFFII